MIDKAQLLAALGTAAKLSAIPLREPSTARPSFRSRTLLYTKTRPIPVGATWLDYLVVQPGQGLAPQRHIGIVKYWVATGLLDPVVTGLEYRFMLDGSILNPALFSLTPGIERNVDRGSTTPWPVQPQRVHIVVGNNQVLRLQVRHSSPVEVVALASLTGWFALNLGNNNKEMFEATGFDQEDTVGATV